MILRVMFLAILAALLSALGGCSWTVPDWAAKAQAALRDEVSPRAEQAIKKECKERAVSCMTNGVSADRCGPLRTCIAWGKRYSAAARTIHKGLAEVNAVWYELEPGSDAGPPGGGEP